MRLLLFLICFPSVSTIFGQSGNYDSTFAVGLGFTHSVYSLKIQADGKVVVTGSFEEYQNHTINQIVRLNSDASLDTTFNTGTGINGIGYNKLVIQKDDKILIGGSFSQYNGNQVKNLVRIMPNGDIDTTFSVGFGFQGASSRLDAITLQDDNRIIVAGRFTAFNGTTAKRIIRLMPDGTRDTSFNTGTGFDSIATIAEIQSDGKILVGGIFNTFNGLPASKITRLNSDGSKDSTFTFNEVINGSVWAIGIYADGKILIGGDFDIPQSNHSNILRLNADGSIDPTFIKGSGLLGEVNTIRIQEDQKALLIGSLGMYNYVPRNRLMRLNYDGTLDLSLDIGSGFSSPTLAIDIQDDDKLIVGGNFASYNGITSGKIARLSNCIKPYHYIQDTACITYTFNNTQYSQSGKYTFSFNNTMTCDSTVVLDLKIYPEYDILLKQDTLIAVADTPAASFQWIDCANNSEISGATGSFFVPAKNGSYAVKVTQNGCSEVSDCVNVNTVGFETTELAPLVFPNPVSDFLSIKGNNSGPVVATLRTVAGIMILQKVFQSESDVWDVSDIPAGLYFLELVYNDKKHTCKVIIN